jgi:hypothetical protein
MMEFIYSDTKNLLAKMRGSCPLPPIKIAVGQILNVSWAKRCGETRNRIGSSNSSAISFENVHCVISVVQISKARAEPGNEAEKSTWRHARTD